MLPGYSPAMRSDRRHHRERLKRRRAGYWGGAVAACSQPGIVVDTPKPCSCWMCGNPRRHLGEKSLQERSADALARRSGC